MQGVLSPVERDLTLLLKVKTPGTRRLGTRQRHLFPRLKVLLNGLILPLSGCCDCDVCHGNSCDLAIGKTNISRLDSPLWIIPSYIIIQDVGG